MRNRLVMLALALVSVGTLFSSARASVAAWYRFEDGTPGAAAGAITDSSGNDLVGTGVGGPTYSSSVGVNPLPGGIANTRSMSFNGNQRIFIPDYPALALTHSLTVEAWVNASSNQFGKADIVFRGDNRGGLDPYNLYINQNASAASFLVTDAAGNSAIVTAPMPSNQWVELAGTLDDATGSLRLYVNGVLGGINITTVRPFGPLQSDQSPGVAIGGLQTGNQPPTPENFTGLIDEVRISDTALPSSQLLAPEPSSAAVLAIGCACVLTRRRRARSHD